MRFLADANIEKLIVDWLRDSGHDVFWAVTLPPRTPDSELVDLALQEKRVIITSDSDFGAETFHWGKSAVGVIYLRLSTPVQLEKLELLQFHWETILENMPGSFIVINDRKARIRTI